MKADTPLCVDLDGTLVRTDTLLESVVLLLKRNPLYLLLLPGWVLKGKARFKALVADHVTLDAAHLPYHAEFLDFLRGEHQSGRQLVLVTAANQRIADAVNGHLGLFQDVLASSESTNLSGGAKRDRLVERYGAEGFDYAANARIDLHIWQQARRIILVNPARGVEDEAQKLGKEVQSLSNRKFSLRLLFSAIRVHQWIKNLLVFVPLFTSHRWGSTDMLLNCVLGFAAFGLCASSVYLLNDLTDLQNDRAHPRKKHRALASGEMDISFGIALIPLLLAGAAAIAVYLPVEFTLVLSTYYALTLAYSFGLKNLVLIDVLVLSALYTWRILAGAALIEVTLSFWLLAFSVFIFLSLAMVKRSSELIQIQEIGEEKIQGRGYQTADIDTVRSLGVSAGYLSVLVLALYINSENVILLYSRPELIWTLCPILLYWLSRIWLITMRGEMHDDPVLFAVRDKASRIMGLMMVAFLLLAI